MIYFVLVRLAALITSARLVKGASSLPTGMGYRSSNTSILGAVKKSVAADLDMEPAPDVHEKRLSTSSCEEMVMASQNS
jgi:hypothetical protein